jgi:hypothetical protein
MCVTQQELISVAVCYAHCMVHVPNDIPVVHLCFPVILSCKQAQLTEQQFTMNIMAR